MLMDSMIGTINLHSVKYFFMKHNSRNTQVGLFFNIFLGFYVVVLVKTFPLLYQLLVL